MRRTLTAAAILPLAMALAAPAWAAKPAKPAPAPAAADIPPPPPPSTPLPPVPPGKLAAVQKPLAYRLDLTVDPAQERFSGHVEVDAELLTPTSWIDMHGRDLKMSKVTITAGGRTLPAQWSEQDPTGVGRLSFGEMLPAGRVTLAFDYDAAFGHGPAGLFRVKVGDDWYSWSQFESIDARAAFPAFDEPGSKTPFTVTLRTPKGLTAVSNAPEVSTTEEGGLTVHRFAPTLPLPTYLVAMMVGPFAVAEGAVPPSPQRKEPLPLRIVSTKQNAGQLNFALENSKTIVTLLESYFGQPFPYPKLDQITSPIMPGAMENAGADLYADNLLVLDDKSPVPQKRAFGMVVSHELAHQWFGDLVTPAWWDDIWLNESFANWMGFRIGGEWRSDLKIGSGATQEGFGAMGTDSLLAGRPIHQKIETNSQIDAAFDTITYGKGGHVVAMIAAFMGDDRFREGVRRYMARHKYGNATSADFFGAMAEVSGDPRILPAMQSFTDQQGVPLLSFTRAKGGYKVVQSRYARLGTTPPDTRWGVPMCVARGKARQCQLLSEKEGMVSIKGSGAFMPNAGGTGYYRFELPRADWDALIARANRLSGNEALALADSLRASFLAGRASAAQLAALAEKLAANPDSHAQGAALDGLEMLEGAGLLDDAASKVLRQRIARLYQPRLDKLGLDLSAGAYAGEDPEVSQGRSAVVGALIGNAKSKVLKGRFADAAAARIAGDTKALDPLWYGPGLSSWLDREGLAGAKLLAEKALASEDPNFRPAALSILGGSGNKEIASWLLDGFQDKRLRASERFNLIRGVIGSGGTRDMGYDWMKAHLDQLLGGAGGIFFASRLPQSLNGFCSAARADAIAADLGKRLAGTTAELELARTVERVRSCGALQTARKAETSAEIAALKP